jgi:hypothetical protein
MAQIDLQTIQLIVENNIRNAGLQGQFENGWKQDISSPNGTVYPQQFNLQTLRDIISKSILDALTNNLATGTISTGNVAGTPIVQDISNDVVINSNYASTNSSVVINPNQAYILNPSLALLAPKGASRVGDPIVIDLLTDPNFMAWVTTVSAAVSALTGGSLQPIVQISGAIINGSQSVKIGD